MAQIVARHMGKELKYRLVSSESARPGYDRHYGLDGSKLMSLGWTHPVSTIEAIKKIVDWTISKPYWVV